MSRLAFALAALALVTLGGGCAARQDQAACDLRIDTTLAFTSPDAEDVVSARLLGPACDKTAALYVVSTADGHPIWSWSAPTAHAFGVSFENKEEAEGFLTRWAAPALLRAGALPAWPRGGAAPAGLHAALDQVTYEDIRARDLPVLCHLSAVGREACVFWEPAAAAAGLLLTRDAASAGADGENL